MTRILIIGGGGMVGQKLAASLGVDGIGDDQNPHVTLFDLAFGANGAPASARVAASVSDPGAIENQIAARPDLIFHVASIVSGEAETDFDKGWRVNHAGFWAFLEALRAEHLASGASYCPKVVFTSSIAAFGPPFPDQIGDEFLCAPQTSYGAHKAISELMLGDFSRKGFIDGIAIRLPTICVRPGKANLAASSFFSGIIRELLNGQQAVLPVDPGVRHWHASPRSAVGFLRHAAELDADKLGGRRTLNLPGVSCTVEEQIEALRDIAGSDVAALIRTEPDQAIMKIVGGWPQNFAPKRAEQLGFTADRDFDAIIRAYIEDDLRPDNTDHRHD